MVDLGLPRIGNSSVYWQEHIATSSDDVGCLHCGQPRIGNSQFCCTGCHSVYALIHDLDLGNFYKIAEPGASKSVRTQINEHTVYPELFDCKEVSCQSQSGDTKSIQVSLPDLSCYACVWLCEHAVAKEFSGSHLHINFATKTGRISVSESSEVSFAQVVSLLRRLGYQVLPVRNEDIQREARKTRMRLGVAWFSALNIMALSAAEYVDLPIFNKGLPTLDPAFQLFLRILQLGFMFPVISIAAIPFFQGVFRAFIQRKIALDIPIAINITALSLYSLFQLRDLHGAVYFDSISAGVALLLTGRAILAKIMQDSERRLLESAQTQQLWARRLSAKHNKLEPQFIASSSVKLGDHLVLLPGDIAVVRCKIIRGQSQLDKSAVSGEPDFYHCKVGDEIPAHSVNLGSRLEVKALENGSNSYWANAQQYIWDMKSRKASWAKRTERFASYFFAAIVMVALATMLAWLPSVEGLNRAMAAMLIACPCAFGFAIPLCFARLCANGLSRGVIFRNQHAIERLVRCKNLVFDKTGTLTLGKLSVTKEDIVDKSGNRARMIEILSVFLQGSGHSCVAALREFYQFEHKFSGLPAPLEVWGEGMCLAVEGETWRLGSPSFCKIGDKYKNADLCLSLNGNAVIIYQLEDCILPSAKRAVEILKDADYSVYMLSGDHSPRVEQVAKKLNIKVLEKGASPDRKLEHLLRLECDVAMIGNGTNDSLAIAGASVGIAVAGSTAMAKDAADIVFVSQDLRVLLDAIELAQAAKKSVTWTFSFATMYNIFGLIAAVLGYVNPLVAAVLMPISSLCIIFLSNPMLYLGRSKREFYQ